MSEVLFFLASIAAITGAIGVVSLRNPFYAVLALVCHLVSLAALFLLLRAEFVAAAQVVVYAGAVMVLYIFVVAYVGGGEESSGTGKALRVVGPLFAIALAVELCIALLGSALSGIDSQGAPYKLGFGTPAQIGKLFLTDYLFVFEVASLLLLVAAVGAIVLARRRRGLEDEDPGLARLIQTPRPAYTGTIAEGAGVRKVLQALEEAHGGVIALGFPNDEQEPASVAEAADEAGETE
ncbi:MAG TPA: NADH-quinone oxidoreductase subunit J [Solirubrobacteraceae bacterium]|nr:NADH-quinone oxidoreductase subunit J [Solirubrobacteraceae bacterium]